MNISSLCQGLSPNFHEEDRSFFTSLHSQLDQPEGTIDPRSFPRPDLPFVVGGYQVDTHMFIMSHFCRNLANSDALALKKGKKKGGLTMVATVPEYLGVTLKAFLIFRNAIYLKELPPTSFDLWIEIRRLAVFLNCDMILQKCDDLEVTMGNASFLFRHWPEGSRLKDKALEFIKGHLKTLIETEAFLGWSQDLWKSILSGNDLSSATPREDDIFIALMRWKDWNKDDIDDANFRTVFRPLLRYHLMTEELLLSVAFAESGMLEADEILWICDEKKNRAGVTATTFSITSRSASAPVEDSIEDEDGNIEEGMNVVELEGQGQLDLLPIARKNSRNNSNKRPPSKKKVKQGRKKSDVLKHDPRNLPLPLPKELLNSKSPPPRTSRRTRKQTEKGQTLQNEKVRKSNAGKGRKGARPRRRSRVTNKENPTCGFPKCGMTFPTPIERLDHERAVHKGFSPWRCYFCSKLFSSDSKMKRHMTVHTLEVPFPCPRCGFEFSREDNLKQHMDNVCMGNDSTMPDQNTAPKEQSPVVM